MCCCLAMSKNQDDKGKLKRTLRAVMKKFIIHYFSNMLGIMVCAEPIVRILLTDKWLPCVPNVANTMFVLTFYSTKSANLQAIKCNGAKIYS